MTRALPPAVRLVLVKPTSTQKPMNRTSTNTVLAPSPWSAPRAICITSLIGGLVRSRVLVAGPGSRPGVHRRLAALLGRLQPCHVVVHQATPHFFHCDAFGLVQDHRQIFAETRPRAAAQLLRAERCHIDEEEPALNRRRRLTRNVRLAAF